MSIYCTNCKWLDKEVKTRDDYCRRCNPDYKLQRLQGNPIKLLQCVNENWYEPKLKENKMNRTKEMMKVIQAYLDGKQIQWKDRNFVDEWKNCEGEPSWHLNNDYRIKPEPKYRPLNDNEMRLLVGKVIVEKSSGNVLLVTCAKQEMYEVKIHTTQSWFTSSFLLEHFTYTDDTPVGKLEK